MGTLVVRRVEVDESRHRRRAFKVLIDERDVGRLKRGQSATFELSPGSHIVRVWSDWAAARRRLILSGDRDHHALRCGPGAWTLPVFTGVNPYDSYLFLEADINIMGEREKWPMDRIYADLHRSYRSFVLLTTDGTLADLSRLGISLTSGLELRMWTDDADAAGDPDPILFEGIALWDAERDCWVADVHWWRMRHASGNQYGTFADTRLDSRPMEEARPAGKQRHVCWTCGERFETQEALSRHIATMHRDQSINEP